MVSARRAGTPDRVSRGDDGPATSRRSRETRGGVPPRRAPPRRADTIRGFLYDVSTANRYPTPVSVNKYFGRAGSGSSFCRSWFM